MPENTLRIFDRVLNRLIKDERDRFADEELRPIRDTLEKLSHSYEVHGIRSAINEFMSSPHMSRVFERRAEERLTNALRGEKELPL